MQPFSLLILCENIVLSLLHVCKLGWYCHLSFLSLTEYYRKNWDFTLRTLKTRPLHFLHTSVIRMLFFQPSLNILFFLKIFREYCHIVRFPFSIAFGSGWCQESNIRARLHSQTDLAHITSYRMVLFVLFG